MEKLPEWFLTLSRVARTRSYFWDGLIASLLLAGGFYYGIISVLASPLSQVRQILLPGIGPEYFELAYLGSHLLLGVLIVLVWGYRRRVPRFAPGKVGVLFSSSNPDIVEPQVEDLLAQVRAELKQRDISNIIEVRTVPAHIRVRDVQDADSILRKARAALMVWGPFERSEIEGRRFTGFPKINFTYMTSTTVSDQFHKDVALGLVGRKWAFEEKNEFVEKRLVAENIAHVALNIVGMALLVTGHFVQAGRMFSVLDTDLELARRTPTTPGYLKTFCGRVRKNRVNAVALQLAREYQGSFKSGGIYSAPSDQLLTWRTRVNEVIKLDKQDSRLHVFHAIVCFLSNDIVASLKASQNAAACAPTADPSPDFCAAFLYLFNGEFRKARSCYKKALAKKGSHDLPFIIEIVEFIQQVSERYPGKFQLHFALGLLNDERLDHAVAVDEYGLFIKQAASDPYYRTFVAEATRRLKRLTG